MSMAAPSITVLSFGSKELRTIWVQLKVLLAGLLSPAVGLACTEKLMGSFTFTAGGVNTLNVKAMPRVSKGNKLV